MELYADENFPLRVVLELRQLGHDVITAFEDGRANQSVTDQDLLARATELDRAVLTLNRLDFNDYTCRWRLMPELLSAQKIRIVLDKHNESQSRLPNLESCEAN